MKTYTVEGVIYYADTKQDEILFELVEAGYPVSILANLRQSKA